MIFQDLKHRPLINRFRFALASKSPLFAQGDHIDLDQHINFGSSTESFIEPAFPHATSVDESSLAHRFRRMRGWKLERDLAQGEIVGDSMGSIALEEEPVVVQPDDIVETCSDFFSGDSHRPCSIDEFGALESTSDHVNDGVS
jgi:hypothetical protein